MPEKDPNGLERTETRPLLCSWGSWILLSFVFLGLHAYWSGLLVFQSADSFQYCSVAENILRGDGPSTSIVHFDEQYHCGTIPAPQTVFPPGYSLLMAAVAAGGVPMSYAGALISLLSYWVLLLLMLLAARSLELTSTATRVVMVLCVANWACCQFATAVLTESLFSTIVLAAFLVLASAESRQSKPSAYFALLLAGSLLAAAGYWIRHAGLFPIAAGGLYYFVRLCIRRDRNSLASCALFGGVTGILTVIGFARNHVLAGSWMGQSSKPVDNPLLGTIFHLGRSLFKFLFGNTWHADFYTDLAPAGFLVTAMPIVIVGAALVAFVLHARRTRTWLTENLNRPLPLLLICYLAVYGSLLVYCGKTTMISPATRMFLPILPGALLLLGCLFPRASQAGDVGDLGRPLKALVGVALVCYIFCHGVAHNVYLARHPQTDPVAEIENWLSEPTEDGTPVSAWIDANIPPSQPLMALPGQSTIYILNRSGVSLCRRRFSERDWDEPRFREVARHYGIHYLVLFPRHQQSTLLAEDSPVIKGLLEGRTPAWMSIAARTENCLIVRLDQMAVPDSSCCHATPAILRISPTERKDSLRNIDAAARDTT